MPGEVLEEYAAWVSRHPCHPGQLIADTLERKSLSALDGATLFGIKCADLTEVLEGRAPITPELALGSKRRDGRRLPTGCGRRVPTISPKSG